MLLACSRLLHWSCLLHLKFIALCPTSSRPTSALLHTCTQLGFPTKVLLIYLLAILHTSELLSGQEMMKDWQELILSCGAGLELPECRPVLAGSSGIIKPLYHHAKWQQQIIDTTKKISRYEDHIAHYRQDPQSPISENQKCFYQSIHGEIAVNH